MIGEPRQPPDETMDLGRRGPLWRDDIEDEYGEAAVVGTVGDRAQGARRGGRGLRGGGAGDDALAGARSLRPRARGVAM